VIGTPVHFGGMTGNGQRATGKRSFLNLIFQNRAITKMFFIGTPCGPVWTANFKMLWYVLLRPLRPEQNRPVQRTGPTMINIVYGSI
jgi:hypothetical protein